jgi:hypothetical protein
MGVRLQGDNHQHSANLFYICNNKEQVIGKRVLLDCSSLLAIESSWFLFIRQKFSPVTAFTSALFFQS